MASWTGGWAPASALGVALAAGWAAAQGAPSRPDTVLNPGFEAVAGGVPSGWLVQKPNGKAAFRFETVPGRHGKGARLSLADAGEGMGVPYGAVYQEIDATPYRGKRIRFRASLKVVKPGVTVGLGLRVERPGPKSAGFTDMMQGDWLAVGDWTDVEIVGRVAIDAVKIWVAVNARGDADVSFDDVAFEAVPIDTSPPSHEARDYLGRAIAILRDKHIDSRTADWPRIIADAHADIGGAKTPRDTYPAIRGVLGALGEKHSFLVAAPRAKAPAAPGAPAAKPVEPPMPTSELIGGRIGVVRLPALGGIGVGQDVPDRYTGTLRTALKAMDDVATCGWIVDLRGNGGGNMWPMLRGLDPLLGKAPFGTFEDVAGNVTYWQRNMGNIFPSPGRIASGSADGPYFSLRNSRAPLAVLIGPGTASSGEMVAIALVGREGVRLFGTNSANYVTGNSVFPLSDGASLVVTGTYVFDRTGKAYDSAIVPDVVTGDAQGEAVRWLTGQCKAA